MLDNKKLLYTVTALSLAGVLALFAYSTTISPEAVPLGEISKEHVGRVVTTNGTISSARTLSDGSISLQIMDLGSMSGISVYFPASAYEEWEGNLTPGSIVEVTGEVLLYQEELELSVASASDVLILSGPGSTNYELRTIMDSIEMFDGMTITTNGTMLDIATIESGGELIGTCFSLYRTFENESYSLECMAFDTDLSDDFEDWQFVEVTGQISYYSNKGTWQLVVENIVLTV